MQFKSWMIILMLMVAIPTVILAQDDGDPGAVVDRYFDAYRGMQPHQLEKVYAPDGVFEDVSQRHRVEGVGAIREYLAQLVRLHSKLGVREKRRIISGNLVAVEFVYTGTLSGEALCQATGKDTCQDTSYELPVTSWFEVEDGLIVVQTDFIDLMTLQDVKKRASGETLSRHWRMRHGTPISAKKGSRK